MTTKLSNEEARQELVNRQAAIARLRKSREAVLDGRIEEGSKLGAKWAAERASYDELERLSEFREGGGYDYQKVLSAQCGGWPGQAFVQVVRPRSTDEAALAFWSDLLCENCDELANDVCFVLAFADAAADFFEDVSDELD